MKSFLSDYEIKKFIKKELDIMKGELILSKSYEKGELSESIIDTMNRMYYLGRFHGSVEGKMEIISKLENKIENEK